MRAIERVADMIGLVDLELFIEQVGRLRAWDAANRTEASSTPDIED